MPLFARPGHLIVHGGGTSQPEVARLVVRLAGGPDAPLVLLPQTSAEPGPKGRRSAQWYAEAGARSVFASEIARPGDPALPALVGRLEKARAVWMPGGDQNRLMAVFAGSPVPAAVRDVFARGGVVGGSSAGASLIGERMPTGEGDRTKFLSGSVETAPGLGLLPGFLFDTHLLARERTQRLVGMVLSDPRLTGVGLDENAWIHIDVGADRVTVGAGQIVVVRAHSRVRLAPDRRLGADDIRLRVLLPGESVRLRDLRPPVK